jgi:hypothetical protein
MEQKNDESSQMNFRISEHSQDLVHFVDDYSEHFECRKKPTLRHAAVAIERQSWRL